MNELFLAVDGGNSKTDVVLGDLAGTIHARARSGPFRPQVTGVRAALDALETVVAQVTAAAGQVGQVGQAGRIDALSAFVAGADLPQEEEALQAAFVERGWARRVHVANDTFALLHAGSPNGTGVAVVCGTGINCVGIGPDGSVARFPALGALSGDWGGGQDIGTEMLWHAVRGEDGRGPRTALTAAVAGHFGLRTALDVTLAIHTGELAEGELRTLTPALFALTGDPVARSVVDRQAGEVCALGLAALRRLGLEQTPTPVILGGGVLGAADPYLLGRISEGFAQRSKAELRVVTEPPVAGAALHALGTEAGTVIRERLLDQLRAVRMG
ncbi:N-acetylglucosamine kinase-like BadF-type ATPase [Catenulispora sp. GAS73]|uniref:N-acetylglucosamine kinase n=1 Tax=Catenulispora sp. GAS73 TaxID=3156269 RepID=UPI003514FDBD